jgi:hypothetical protein
MSEQSKKADSGQSNDAPRRQDQTATGQAAQTGAGATQGSQVQGPAPGGGSAAQSDPALVAAVSQFFRNFVGGGVPGPGKAEQDALKLKLERCLTGAGGGCSLPGCRPDSITVAFPPCSDVMLSLAGVDVASPEDQVKKFFDDYFQFRSHQVLGGTNDDDCANASQIFDDLDQTLNPDQLDCTFACGGSPCNDDWNVEIESSGSGNPTLRAASRSHGINPGWPPSWCFPSSCVTLRGRRRLEQLDTASRPIRRLYVGDALWLFYMERMGIFQIVGALLDDFTITGRLPISNGSLQASEVRDDIVALILEAMTRQMETGNASTLRRRISTYMRTLGWTLPNGRSLGLNSVVHTGFNREYHEVIRLALIYYREKQLASAIQNTISTTTAASTLTALADRIDELKRGFETFQYGRNYANTLSGIVWAIAGMSLVRELAPTLGIPSPSYQAPYEYIPAAYEILVERRATPTTRAITRVNRFIAHRDCAENGRAILLDIEALDNTAPSFRSPGGEVETWLAIAEDEIEGYRGAYLALTGTDLGAKTPALIEQQA